MILDTVFYLIDIDDTPLRALPLSVEWKLEDLKDSTNVLEIRIPLNESGRIVSDQGILFEGRRFLIYGIAFDKDAREIVLSCEEAQARLTDANIPNFTLKDSNLVESMEKALAKTPAWKVGNVFETTRNFNAELKNVSEKFALRFLERQSGGRLVFDSGRRIVHMVDGADRVADVVFRYGENIANIHKEETAPRATVLYAYGRDGMTIEAVTGGKKYVEDFSWYTGLGMTLKEARAKYTKELVWEDERYIYNSNLHRDAVTRLALLSQPQINYKLENAEIDGLELAMMAYVHDEELGIRVKVEASKIIRSSNSEENEIELDYMPPSLGATIDNEYSGDTNTGGNGETSFFLQKNQSIFTVTGAPAPVITSDVTVFSATAFEMGFSVMMEVTSGGLLEGYFLLDGEKLPVEIKQTVAPGWYTFGMPFIVTGIQEGTRSLHFYLQFNGAGAATIQKERAEFFVKASGVYGGATNDKPDQSIVEEVEIPAVSLNITENAIEFRDLPRRFNPVEMVEIPVVSLNVTESHNVFLDPPPVGSPPPPPLSDTQIRAEFADMRAYEQPTRPTQTEADHFIDETHAEANHFAILATDYTVYLIACYGSYLDITFKDGIEPGGVVIASDGELYISYGPNNVFRGLSIDWSQNNPYPWSLTERYDVPEPVAPGEAGPPRRIQYANDYSLTETEILYTPGAGDRLALTPVEEGIVYRVTRGAASTGFAVGFTTSEPVFNETAEPIVTGYALQDPALLEMDLEAPAGAAELVIYEQGVELPEIVIRAVEPLEPVEPEDPTARTREDFAIMSNYSTYSVKPSQTAVNAFIDGNLSHYPLINVFTSDDYSGLFITATKGTYIEHDGAGNFVSDAPFKLLNSSRAFSSSGSGSHYTIGATYTWIMKETLIL